jgi:hypothetical protein
MLRIVLVRLLHRLLRLGAFPARREHAGERVEHDVRVGTFFRRRTPGERLRFVEPLLLQQEPGEVVQRVA